MSEYSAEEYVQAGFTLLREIRENEADRANKTRTIMTPDFTNSPFGINVTTIRERMSEADKKTCQDAINCFNAALKINPRKGDAWIGKAYTYLTQNECIKGIRCTDYALEINPRDPESWVARGHCLVVYDQIFPAITCFEKAIELDPKNETLKQRRDSLVKRLPIFQRGLIHKLSRNLVWDQMYSLLLKNTKVD
jgi:tetratricopeptide (TPR) repeat protein